MNQICSVFVKKSLINLPREDLANIIGTSRESLGRLLKEFKEENLIKIDKRTIALNNLKNFNRYRGDELFLKAQTDDG